MSHGRSGKFQLQLNPTLVWNGRLRDRRGRMRTIQPTYAAPRSPRSCRSHLATWFQLAKMRVTYLSDVSGNGLSVMRFDRRRFHERAIKVPWAHRSGNRRSDAARWWLAAQTTESLLGRRPVARSLRRRPCGRFLHEFGGAGHLRWGLNRSGVVVLERLSISVLALDAKDDLVPLHAPGDLCDMATTWLSARQLLTRLFEVQRHLPILFGQIHRERPRS